MIGYRPLPSYLFAALLACISLPIAAQTNFGPVNVGSSTTATVTITILSAATLGSISVRTEGAENLDFTNAGGGTCIVGNSYVAGATCTVVVGFLPPRPGPSYGAVVLLDSTSNQNILATSYILGTGQGPQVAFPFGPKVDLGPVPIYPYLNSGSGADYSPGDMAIDGRGNLYIASQEYGITKWTLANGGYSQAALDTNFTAPGIALDGAGNVFYACNSSVCRQTPGANGTYSQSIAVNGLQSPSYFATDGYGNLYLTDSGAGALYKETLQPDGSYLQSTIGSGASGAVAVDGTGDVYALVQAQLSAMAPLLKETPSGGAYTESVIDSSLPMSFNLTVDGSGKIYIAEGGYFNVVGHRSICNIDYTGTNLIAEKIPQADGSYLEYPQTDIGGFINPEVVALDRAGNLYVVDTWDICSVSYGELYTLKANYTHPPSLAFGSVLYGSSGGPQVVTLSNSGNQPLTFSSITYPTGFPEDPAATTDCKVSAPLPPGNSCTLSIDFTPPAALSNITPRAFSGKVTFKSNSLTGAQQSIAVSGTEIPPTVTTPVLSVAGGLFPAGQILTVTITDATANATIYYTTNGSSPTTSSLKYTGPITISATTTLSAIAVRSLYVTSATVSAFYQIQQPAPAPSFSPPGGTYNNAQTITIADAAPGATIYYTLNGTTPTTASTKYVGPVAIRTPYTLQAVAVSLPGYTLGSVGSAKYNFIAATPTASPAGGTYASAQTVTLTTATAHAAIRYTTNGSIPNGGSKLYTGPVAVNVSENLKAIAMATGYTSSAIASNAYVIGAPVPAATPTFSPAAGTYSNAQTVAINDATPGAFLYYTLNGTTPTTASTKYTGPIAIKGSYTLQAIAQAPPGFTVSATGSAHYTLTAAPPVVSTPGGTYTGPQTVTITTASTAAHLYYTTNGATPTNMSKLYTGPITVSASETLKVIAAATGYTSSPVVTEVYIIH